MELAGEYTFNAPREVVWDSIMDPEVLANILPGCDRLEKVNETEYKGVFYVPIGVVQGRLNSKMLLSDMNKPESFHIDIDGKGEAGFINGGGDARLDAIDGNTVLTYSGEAQVGGSIASVEQHLLDTSAKPIVPQALESLDRIIQVKMQPEPDITAEVAAPIPEIEPPTQRELAIGVAKDLYDEFVPEERQPLIMGLAAALGAVLALLLLFKLLRREGNQ